MVAYLVDDLELVQELVRMLARAGVNREELRLLVKPRKFEARAIRIGGELFGLSFNRTDNTRWTEDPTGDLLQLVKAGLFVADGGLGEYMLGTTQARRIVQRLGELHLELEGADER